MKTTPDQNIETVEIEKKRLPLELLLFSQLQTSSKHLAQEIVSSYNVSRQTTISNIINSYKDDIIVDLKKNYRQVSTKFGTWNRDKFNAINKDIVFDIKEISSEVQDFYNTSFADFVSQSSQTHAEYIIKTIEEDVYRSISDSKTMIENDIFNLQSKRDSITRRLAELAFIGVADKKLLSERNNLLNRLDKLEETIRDMEASKNAKTINTLGTVLRRTNTKRNQMRAYQETSYAQAGSMQIEAESMVKEDRKIKVGLFTGTSIATITFKEWDGIRDGKQRPAHLLATGQKRKINEPFIVGGELGQFPRDDSFSIGNKARCRCHVIYKFGG